MKNQKQSFVLFSALGFLAITLCSSSCSHEDDPTPTPTPVVVVAKDLDTTQDVNRAEKLTFTWDGVSTTSEHAYVYQEGTSFEQTLPGRQIKTATTTLQLDLSLDSSQIVQPSLIGTRLPEELGADNSLRTLGQMTMGFYSYPSDGSWWASYDVKSDAGLGDYDTSEFYHNLTSVKYLGRVNDHAYFLVKGDFKLNLKKDMENEFKTVTGSYQKIWKTSRK